MTQRVRVAKITDMNAIGDVMCAAWQAGYRGIIPAKILNLVSAPNFAEKAKTAILKPRNECSAMLVALNGARIVGVLQLGDARDQDLHSNLVGEIESIYIHPDYWRQGFGSRLLEAALDGMKAQGFEEVAVWTATHNGGATQFYANHRFRSDGAKREVSAGGQEIPNLRLRRILHV